MQSLEKKTLKDNSGFTIIEVMIVLVIAAVIILIVFLAVPALQRNSRNNQRKNDASRISAAVTETANNANGLLPTTLAPISANYGTLGFYGTLVVDTDNAANGAQTDTNSITYVTQGVCAAGGATTNGSARQFAIQYAVETGGNGNSPQCLQG